MECNKDEAFRAKEIAERNVTKKDYAGARKFALKAQNLYPGLDGISQMLTTLDVYISAEKKVNGEVDWYGVLGVNPSAEDDVVAKQYGKLAPMLHPDKNKSVGAAGAFKLVTEAWSLLSDKTKRLAYNRKMSFRGTQKEFPSGSVSSSMPPRPNSCDPSGSNMTSSTRARDDNFWAGQSSFASPSNMKSATFWTACNGCMAQCEYLRVYLNHTLLCANCREPFLALEKAPPPNANINMLVDKARTMILEKLKEWNSGTVKENCSSESPASSPDESDTGIAPLSINVPDPDFHNFDLDRSESSFQDDQVWAAYDNDDGMPRFYARIHKVVSLNPFKMKISWLSSRSNNEFGSLNWLGSGFTKTCGEFRSGRREITETLNSFSHKVHWTKGARGTIRIFPRKGDVWAVYRNWSPDWNEHTPDEVIHKYDMVEVLDDYNEEQGVFVIPLVKVAGFRTVFLKHNDPNEVKRVRKEEMFRFSHQVPNYLLTGQEARNAPAGCHELDPAATPLELLHMINEADEAAMEDDLG
ncbi:hypothetical protein V6N11_060215 [Hibiscus sabdariffa]|uniref:J domain-containing protein n=2 Tax=Hibiscus sabdariffa TaxID=183260 RepID=A0ABR2CNK3_9ROSI